jgi:hypothetical protein
MPIQFGLPFSALVFSPEVALDRRMIVCDNRAVTESVTVPADWSRNTDPRKSAMSD